MKLQTRQNYLSINNSQKLISQIPPSFFVLYSIDKQLRVNLEVSIPLLKPSKSTVQKRHYPK